MTDGSISSLALSGSTLYFGGSFSRVSTEPLGDAANISTLSGSASSQATVVGGEVLATVPDGSGGWYLGGTFTEVGGQPRAGLAHIRSDGTVDPAFAPSLSTGATVSVLVLSGSTLYVGGSFSQVDGITRENLAAVNSGDGSLDPAFDPSVGEVGAGSVSALLISGSTLYVGGAFGRVDGVEHTSLAAVNVSTGTLDATFDPSVTDGGEVYALALSGNTLYLGGVIQDIDGSLIGSGLAAVDSGTGALDSSFKPYINGILEFGPFAGGVVYSLVVSGNTLYVGGNFDRVDEADQDNLAALDATDGSLVTTFNPEPTEPNNAWDDGGEVTALVLSGSTLYIAGSFAEVAGVTRNNVAAVNVSDGSATSWSPEPGGKINALALSGSQIEAAGDVRFLGGTPRESLAAIDTSDGSLDSTFAPTIATAPGYGYTNVTALTVSGGVLYLGGDFSEVDGEQHICLAAVSTSAGTVMPDFDPTVVNGRVSALATTGDTLYVAGNFEDVDSTSGAGLAAVNTGNGSFDPTIDPTITVENPPGSGGEPGPVSSLLLSGNTLYFGGQFDHVDGSVHEGLAALNTTDGSLDTSFDPSVVTSAQYFQPTTALALSGNTLYLGGQFDQADGANSNGLAAVDASDGTPITGFAPTLSSSADTSGDEPEPPLVSALTLSGGSLYLGGAFNAVDGSPRESLAAVTTGSGTLESGLDPTLPALINALSLSPDATTLYVGGDFNEINDQPAGGLAALPVTPSTGESEDNSPGNPHNPTSPEPEGSPHRSTTSTNLSNANTSPTGQVVTLNSRILAALTAMLEAKSPATKTLLKTDRYGYHFTAPTSGTLAVQWTTATKTGNHKAKLILVARGSRRFTSNSHHAITVRLTAAGRTLLKQHRTLRVTVTATFTPTNQHPQVKHSTITLHAN